MNAPAFSPRVLHLVEATTAGVGQHVLYLAGEQHRCGLEVVVACPAAREGARRDTRFVDRLRAASVPVQLVNLRRQLHPIADFRVWRGLIELMRRWRPDVVHTHSSKAGGLGRLAAARAGVPLVVYTPNAFAFLDAGGGLKRRFYLAIERYLGHHATDALICVSPSEMELALRDSIAPPERLVMVENTIDAGAYDHNLDMAAAKDALGLDTTRPLVGYVGRLAPQKGLDYFLQAARIVLATMPDVQFIMVGEGRLEPQLGRMITQHNLEKEVRMMGYRPDVVSVLAALDVFVLPSLYEGRPYSLMEALAAGRAVVVTDVGGNREIVRDGETGLWVPARDAGALAAAILQLLGDTGMRLRLGEEARASAQAWPTVGRRARQIIDLYASLLPEKKRGQNR